MNGYRVKLNKQDKKLLDTDASSAVRLMTFFSSICTAWLSDLHFAQIGEEAESDCVPQWPLPAAAQSNSTRERGDNQRPWREKSRYIIALNNRCNTQCIDMDTICRSECHTYGEASWAFKNPARVKGPWTIQSNFLWCHHNQISIVLCGCRNCRRSKRPRSASWSSSWSWRSSLMRTRSAPSNLSSSSRRGSLKKPQRPKSKRWPFTQTRYLLSTYTLSSNSCLERCLLCTWLLQEASECLKKHNQRIQVENHRLRRELQELIEVTNALQLHKKRLERQYRNVIREHQFSQSLKQLRGSVFRGQELTADLDLQLGEYEPESEIGLPQLN